MSSTHDDRSIAATLLASRTVPADHRGLLENQVVAFFQPLTHSLAHRYAHRGVEQDDLEQVADLALLKAMRRYDPQTGDLRGYVAATVLGEIKKYFRDHSWTVRPPRHIQDLQTRVMGAFVDPLDDPHERPRTVVVAERLGVDHAVVTEVLMARGGFRSLSLEWSAEPGGPRLGDQVVDARDDHQETERHLFVSFVCDGLDDDERTLLHLRFVEELSQTQIAMRMQSSQKQVSRSLERILASLRQRAVSDAA
jgi:RNA polymerase sigma-B factor